MNQTSIQMNTGMFKKTQNQNSVTFLNTTENLWLGLQTESYMDKRKGVKELKRSRMED